MDTDRDVSKLIPIDLPMAGAEPIRHLRRLNELPSGTLAVVHRIEGTDAALHRLMAMGLCVGREIEVVRHGNPLIVRLLRARIGISGRVARQIVVELRP
jgi:Fe2+ transport system protein FeoA